MKVKKLREGWRTENRMKNREQYEELRKGWITKKSVEN